MGMGVHLWCRVVGTENSEEFTRGGRVYILVNSSQPVAYAGNYILGGTIVRCIFYFFGGVRCGRCLRVISVYWVYVVGHYSYC
jgi:hypothetical protein